MTPEASKDKGSAAGRGVTPEGPNGSCDSRPLHAAESAAGFAPAPAPAATPARCPTCGQTVAPLAEAAGAQAGESRQIAPPPTCDAEGCTASPVWSSVETQSPDDDGRYRPTRRCDLHRAIVDAQFERIGLRAAVWERLSTVDGNAIALALLIVLVLLCPGCGREEVGETVGTGAMLLTLALVSGLVGMAVGRRRREAPVDPEMQEPRL